MKKTRFIAALLCLVITVTGLCACSGGEMTDGVFENNVYTNEDMGVAITVDESFTSAFLKEPSMPFNAMNYDEFFSILVCKAEAGFGATAEQYAKQVAENAAETGFTAEKPETVTLAGNEYLLLKTRNSETRVLQDYYILKVKSSFAGIIVTYAEQSKPYAQSFMADSVKAI